MTTARVSPLMSVVLAGLLAIAAGLDRPAGAANLEKAVFAGGCFWCMEEAFEGVEGVVSVASGYIGGMKANPSYEEVSSGSTGHAEAVEVLFDPARTNYPKLLEVFWRNIDPTTPDRQFCDRGSQYRSAIFTLTELQQRQAEESKRAVEQTKPFREPIVTQIVPATTFYPAEDYHQDFYKRNPIRYKFYKYNCGRVQRLEEVWGKSRG
ncbi:Peptide methionine sulfoxide reductase MsrA [Nitrospira tepida]|uniref:Peptide methionine sulfoxide reductase MsrA n=1 Tax=Nitrospira tepida TaxID=2973512 RepID=A0AA86T1M7_9BACT|nr:peptide-methionine (S)-S-oxide reductase MsrA [Nitrospira tepida]CAI4030081.1 Peptide methionine sulfoxide reductase MsrA [Nitrospira tepida]